MPLLQKLKRRSAKGTFKNNYKKGLILVVLGILYNGALQNKETLQNGLPGIRIASVLGQIGLAYLLLPQNHRGYTKSLKSRLIGSEVFWRYAILQLAVPVPGYGAGLLDPEGGINAWIDRLLLPGRLHGKTFDSGRALVYISAISVTLIGSDCRPCLTRRESCLSPKIAYPGSDRTRFDRSSMILSPFYPIIKAAGPFRSISLPDGHKLYAAFAFY
jgi:predicted acyltransferase